MTLVLPDKLLFQTDEQFDRFVEFERERRSTRGKTGGGRPLGARLSIGCPVRMVKALYSPAFDTPIDEGDGERGHELESRFRAIALDGVDHEFQIRVDWGVGISAHDFRLPDGTVLEMKTTTGALRPTSEHRRTTIRRMVAAGLPLGDVQLVLAHPGNYDVRGPFPVLRDGEDEAVIAAKHQAELDAVTRAVGEFNAIDDPEADPRWNDRAWWRDLGLECECGWCERPESWDATPAIERLVSRYHLHLSAWQEALEDVVKTLGFRVKSKEYTDSGLHTKLVEAAEVMANELRWNEAADAAALGQVLDVERDAMRSRIECYAQDYTLVRNKAGRWQIKPRKETNAVPAEVQPAEEVAA